MNKQSPYGKTVILKDDAPQVICWNFANGERYTLPKGTRLLLEHVHTSDSTTCMLVDENGKHPGIPLRHANGTTQTGYRFILKNEQLNRLADANLPDTAFDIVGGIMEYENGMMDEDKTRTFFVQLKEQGLVNRLQGHYGREARRLGVI